MSVLADLAAVLVLFAVLLVYPPPVRHRAAMPTTRSVPGAATDPAVVLDLLAVAVESGADLPRALNTVGVALGGRSGEALCRVAAALRLGAGWPTAWADTPEALRPAMIALEPAWTSGVSAVPALRSASQTERQSRRSRARAASSRLAVHVVLPLGLCFLPSFVLIGVVPVLISLAGQLSG